MKPPRAFFNVLKMRLNIRLRREVVHNYPIGAFIEPLMACNLRCPACPTGLRLGLRPAVTIDEALFRSTLDEVGDYLFRLYFYNWGEPLLHKSTPEMIAYAHAKDITTVLSTNLSLRLGDDYVERLVRSGLDTMIISLDGVSPDTYATYRRGGNFDLVRENLRRLRDTRDRLGRETPRLVWQFLVFRHNEHEIEQARALCHDLGADELLLGSPIMPAVPHDAGFQPSTLSAYNMYDPAHRTQREARRQLREGASCSWLYGMLVLNPGGTVSPCCAVASQEKDFGALTKGTAFFDVWNGDKFRRARRLFVGRREAGATGDAEAAGHLIDGMATVANARLRPSELVCEQCPIPDLQNYTDGIIDGTLVQMMRMRYRDRSPRHLLNYLLMGAPLPSRDTRRWVAHEVGRRVVPRSLRSALKTVRGFRRGRAARVS